MVILTPRHRYGGTGLVDEGESETENIMYRGNPYEVPTVCSPLRLCEIDSTTSFSIGPTNLAHQRLEARSRAETGLSRFIGRGGIAATKIGENLTEESYGKHQRDSYDLEDNNQITLSSPAVLVADKGAVEWAPEKR